MQHDLSCFLVSMKQPMFGGYKRIYYTEERERDSSLCNGKVDSIRLTAFLHINREARANWQTHKCSTYVGSISHNEINHDSSQNGLLGSTRPPPLFRLERIIFHIS